ncbi:uncharacterized protein LOC110735827 [Chenopodium quinoa]|uniref:uncharacterized protein LOC110735827 n=1 Tax=Chenopodium quinoa TaxID=63459 RepID=UPI000B789198|nr:uncharacterized protein LOC110735827 [Chenopodium quinoa]
MTVEDYYTTLIEFYDDLLCLKPPNGCESGSCACNVAANKPNPSTAAPAHPSPVVRANAVGSIASDSSSSSQDNTPVLSALSELQPEHVKILLNIINHRQQDKMIGEYFSLSWNIDTGASHVTRDESYLTDVQSISPCPVGLPDGAQVVATKEGRVYLVDGITLAHVLFVPKLKCNLISVSKMIDDSHCFVRFTYSLCAIQDQHSGSLIGGGERIDGLCYFRRIPKVCAMTDLKVSTFELWHRRMGHPSDRIIKLVPAISTSSGSKSLNKACQVFPQAKLSRDSFPNSDSRASRIFELIHCDLWGSYKTSSTCNAHYFYIIVDDISRGVWVYLSSDKTEVYSSFCSFFAMIKCQFDVTVKCVRSDNGTKFKHMLSYVNEHGILFQTSCVGTPQQNGRVERKHQHILNVSHALMFQGNLPIGFWGECVLGAVCLINRTPSHLLANKTPYEILFGKEPNFDELRVFGSLCFVHNQKAKGVKFAPRSRKCVFVGYPHGKKGWKLYDLEKGEIFVSRNVKFHENEFPFELDNASNATQVDTDDISNHNAGVDLDFLDVLEHILEVGEDALTLGTHDNLDRRSPATHSPYRSSPTAAPASQAAGASDRRHIAAPSTSHIPPTVPTAPVIGHRPDSSSEAAPESPSSSVTLELDRGLRERHPSGWHRGYIAHTISILSPSTSQSSWSTPCSSGTPYSLTNFVNYDKFSLRHRAFIAAVDTVVEPRNFKEAMQDEGWREAMQKEISALEDNETWIMEELPAGKKALGCRWVYKVKLNFDGTIEKLKARLFIFGNHLVEGIDYIETFAPVAKMVTIPAFLAVAAAKKLGIAPNGCP